MDSGGGVRSLPKEETEREGEGERAFDCRSDIVDVVVVGRTDGRDEAITHDLTDGSVGQERKPASLAALSGQAGSERASSLLWLRRITPD